MYMWEKIKNWWESRKERRARRELENALKLEIAVNQLLHDGPNWVDYDFHEVPVLICSVYFQQENDWTIVDFSREDEGIIHYILYTPDPITEYKAGSKYDPNQKEIHTVIPNAVVYKKFYYNGSEFWCFS